MRARIALSGGDDVGERAALWDWLHDEPELRGGIAWEKPPPDPTHLGGAMEVLTVALGSGGAGVALAKSLVTWLQKL